MSRRSNINLIVRDNRVELLLRFTQSADIVKDDFGFFVLLRALGNSGFDGVDDGYA